MKFRKKPIIVEAITFDELVAHGLASGGNVVNGMPWSFQYNGHPITHENDDCYLIPTLEGTMRFGRGDMLITGVAGEIYPCKAGIFEATYEPEEDAHKNHCCHIGTDGDECRSSAEWTIVCGASPHDYTDACTAHVGDMLTDSAEHKIYRLTTHRSEVQP